MAATGAAAYGIAVEPDWLSVEKINVPIAHLPDRLAGYRIFLLADFHADSFLSDTLMQEAIKHISAQTPDLIALSGDYITRERSGMDRMAAWLPQMNAREGIIACRGNHDAWRGGTYIREIFETKGIEYLVNQILQLPSGLWVAGTDSAWGGQPHLGRTLEKFRGKLPIVLLAHEPDIADQMQADPRLSLQLSGHSHGGQIRIPGYGAPILPHLGRKYDTGLNYAGRLPVYTTRGIGTSGIPVRFCCPPELTEITLIPSAT